MNFQKLLSTYSLKSAQRDYLTHSYAGEEKHMNIADRSSYLSELITILKTHWPKNRTVNIVCHGHSVPAGYFATPMVDTINAYPHLLHRELLRWFPATR